MIPVLAAMLALLLLRAETVMDAASQACALFVRSVLPGLLPYMPLALMAAGRIRRPGPGLLLAMGWGGGSPTGGRLLAQCPDMDGRSRVRLAVSCSTMSPMFLLGTVGRWLGSPAAGAVVLGAVLAGGWIAGLLAGMAPRRPIHPEKEKPPEPLSLGQAVEQSARTLLLVCGTMALWRVFAALFAEAANAFAPILTLPAVTLMEVTTGAETIAALPLPLPLRAALIAGSTGFGGAAILLQNRAVWPEGLLSLPEQIGWQLVHGAASALLALGAGLLFLQ